MSTEDIVIVHDIFKRRGKKAGDIDCSSGNSTWGGDRHGLENKGRTTRQRGSRLGSNWIDIRDRAASSSDRVLSTPSTARGGEVPFIGETRFPHPESEYRKQNLIFPCFIIEMLISVAEQGKKHGRSVTPLELILRTHKTLLRGSAY